MNNSSVDIIVRRALLERGLPIHFYGEFLFYASTCIRELSFDTLLLVNSANLPVDVNGNVTLPSDFVDDVSVCIPVGQGLKTLPKQDWITPIRIHDASSYIPYQNVETNSENVFGYPLAGFTWFWNVDSFGSPTGRMFGASGGSSSGYKVLKAQRRIQMTQDFAGSNVVVLYISDGQSVDNATQVDVLAFATVNSFIAWKTSPNRDNEFSAEGRGFINQKRLLRARLNPLTVTDINNILHNAYKATMKN